MATMAASIISSAIFVGRVTFVLAAMEKMFAERVWVSQLHNLSLPYHAGGFFMLYGNSDAIVIPRSNLKFL